MRFGLFSVARNQQRAFTKVELLAVLAIGALLAVVLFAALEKSKRKSQQISCVGRLKIISLGFRVFPKDSGRDWPMAADSRNGGVKEWMGWGTNVYRIFQSLSNELSVPNVLFCPSDTRKPASTWQALQNTNIGYFVGVDAADEYAGRILAGDRNLQASVGKDRDGFLSLTTNEVVKWSASMHQNKGNIAMADGSIQRVSDEQFREILGKSDLATNRFMLPD